MLLRASIASEDVLTIDRAERPIVVAVDPWAQNERAVAWAALLAEACEQPLVLMTTTSERDKSSAGVRTTEPVGALALDYVASNVRSRHPFLDVQTRLSARDPAQAVAQGLHPASVLVVGRRARSSVPLVPALSTSDEAATRSQVPIVVVPNAWTPTPAHTPVVIDLIGLGDHSVEAVEFAFAVAAALQAPLIGFCRRADVGPGAIRERLNSLRAQYPEVEVRLRHSLSATADALVDASRESQLLVVAQPTTSQIGVTQPLDSIVRSVLRDSACPVAVVRTRAE